MVFEVVYACEVELAALHFVVEGLAEGSAGYEDAGCFFVFAEFGGYGAGCKGFVGYGSASKVDGGFG